MMGHTANQCVKLSAVGGCWKPNDPPTPGGVGCGYTVFTCQGVISGDVANWKDAVSVHFYTGYLPPKPIK